MLSRPCRRLVGPFSGRSVLVDSEESRILSHVGFDLLIDRVKLDVMARIRCDSGDRFWPPLGQSKDHCRKLLR